MVCSSRLEEEGEEEEGDNEEEGEEEKDNEEEVERTYVVCPLWVPKGLVLLYEGHGAGDHPGVVAEEESADRRETDRQVEQGRVGGAHHPRL